MLPQPKMTEVIEMDHRKLLIRDAVLRSQHQKQYAEYITTCVNSNDEAVASETLKMLTVRKQINDRLNAELMKIQQLLFTTELLRQLFDKASSACEMQVDADNGTCVFSGDNQWLKVNVQLNHVNTQFAHEVKTSYIMMPQYSSILRGVNTLSRFFDFLMQFVDKYGVANERNLDLNPDAKNEFDALFNAVNDVVRFFDTYSEYHIQQQKQQQYQQQQQQKHTQDLPRMFTNHCCILSFDAHS